MTSNNIQLTNVPNTLDKLIELASIGNPITIEHLNAIVSTQLFNPQFFINFQHRVKSK